MGKAYIVADKTKPEQLCLFYVTADSNTETATIETVINPLYQTLDKEALAKAKNIVTISKVEKKHIPFIKITNKIPETVYKTTYDVTYTYGNLSNTADPKTIILELTQQESPLSFNAYETDQPNPRFNKPTLTHETPPLRLTDGNTRDANNFPALCKRFTFLPTEWALYFGESCIPRKHIDPEQLIDDCLAKDPINAEIASLKSKLESMTPESHRQQLTRDIAALEAELRKEWTALCGDTNTQQGIEKLELAATQAFNALKTSLISTNFGAWIAELTYYKERLISHLQSAALRTVTASFNDPAHPENHTIEQFMETAQSLNDQFQGVAYLDAAQNLIFCDLTSKSLNELVLLVNLLLGKQKDPYLNKALKKIGSPFIYDEHNAFQKLWNKTSGNLTLQPHFNDIDARTEQETLVVKSKSEALVTALNARENYLAIVLAQRPQDQTRELEKKLARLKKKTKPEYCVLMQAIETAHHSKVTLLAEIEAHCDRQFTPIALTTALPESETEATLEEIKAAYVTASHACVQSTKEKLAELKQGLPDKIHNQQEVVAAQAAITTAREKMNALIQEETGVLSALHQEYQAKIESRESEINAQNTKDSKISLSESDAPKITQPKGTEPEDRVIPPADLEVIESDDKPEDRVTPPADLEVIKSNDKPVSAEAILDTSNQAKQLLKQFVPLPPSHLKDSSGAMNFAAPLPTMTRSKKQIAAMAIAITGAALAGVSVTLLCVFTLPVSFPIIASIAIGAAVAISLGITSVATVHCCLFKKPHFDNPRLIQLLSQEGNHAVSTTLSREAPSLTSRHSSST